MDDQWNDSQCVYKSVSVCVCMCVHARVWCACGPMNKVRATVAAANHLICIECARARSRKWQQQLTMTMMMNSVVRGAAFAVARIPTLESFIDMRRRSVQV